MERDAEYYQEKIDLTPEQKKAWTQLVRAINKCKKEGVYFYQVLDSLYGLNGHNVKTIRDDELCRGLDPEAPSCLQTKDIPGVRTTDAFADDNHFIILEDEDFYF